MLALGLRCSSNSTSREMVTVRAGSALCGVEGTSKIDTDGLREVGVVELVRPRIGEAVVVL